MRALCVLNMDKQEAINIAKSAARNNGYTWLEPVRTKKRKKFILFGAMMWHIVSNADKKGCWAKLSTPVKQTKTHNKGFKNGAAESDARLSGR